MRIILMKPVLGLFRAEERNQAALASGSLRQGTSFVAAGSLECGNQTNITHATITLHVTCRP
jgi:hypothetical protein